MSIIAYVSGHGFGHSSREIEILRRLPSDISLTVKSSAPEWFWRQEMTRPFTFVSEAFDVGCLQTTSLETDIAATLVAWQEMATNNQSRFDAERRELQQRGATLIVSDAGSFPLMAAASIGVPSICVANFTWVDIYEEYIPAEPGFAPVVENLRREYSQATLLLEAGLSLPMAYFSRRESVGIVARHGSLSPGIARELLTGYLPSDVQERRLALLYGGTWSLPLRWERLAEFAEWHFVTLTPPPFAVPNLSVAARQWMSHPDLVAAVDLVIAKPGYGMVGECLGAGTPLLYCPRSGFAEYAALDAILSGWDGGFRLSTEQFLGVEWETVLAKVPAYRQIPSVSTTGGEKAAAIIENWYRTLG